MQADAIDVIGDAGPLSLTELSELLVAESGHPSRLVDRLVEAGLVSRRTGAVDRRRIELSPSMSLPAWVVQDADQRGIVPTRLCSFARFSALSMRTQMPT